MKGGLSWLLLDTPQTDFGARGEKPFGIALDRRFPIWRDAAHTLYNASDKGPHCEAAAEIFDKCTPRFRGAINLLGGIETQFQSARTSRKWAADFQGAAATVRKQSENLLEAVGTFERVALGAGFGVLATPRPEGSAFLKHLADADQTLRAARNAVAALSDAMRDDADGMADFARGAERLFPNKISAMGAFAVAAEGIVLSVLDGKADPDTTRRRVNAFVLEHAAALGTVGYAADVRHHGQIVFKARAAFLKSGAAGNLFAPHRKLFPLLP